MKYNDEVTPDNLGGLGDLLPADVLKKLRELLEQLQQSGHANQGDTVINIYQPGSSHVDKVDNQYFGDKWAKAFQGKEPSEGQTPFNVTLDADTPLSALFRENHHEELRRIIDSWRPYLIGDDPSVDALALAHFEFDFDKVIATHIYIDLGRLLYVHALKDDNMSQLAKYLYQHSNLSNSESTLYVQLRKYKKR